MKCSYVLIPILMVLTGCTTVEFVRRDLTPHKKAVLRYLPQSDASSEVKYREKLSRQAREFCGGDFQIIKEYEAREESGNSTGVGTGFGFGRTGFMFGGTSRSTRMYRFVEISCGSGTTSGERAV